ncbi:hypothetical protein D3C81_1780030 [compost metagenome]
MVLEAVRQAEVQYRHQHGFGVEQFGYAGTCAACDHVVFDGDEAFVGARQFQQHRLVQRLDETHVDHAQAELATDLLGSGEGRAEGEQGDAAALMTQLRLADFQRG